MQFDIKHIATLANLTLTTKEEKQLAKQLTETLDYIGILQEVDTKNVPPTAQVTGLENVTRDDVAHDSLSQKDAIANTKNIHNGFFAVNAILENE
jgi:aspartyl-tRNA(Asn)/glutamyl-tRNA(Gln) amidotransferase subunit C